ncbi:MAG: MBL fold metallo-hydrolase [Phycisphaerae bacterium]|nr:MBL fold metallo-hydrolase [Phycisphaerae bacterium]
MRITPCGALGEVTGSGYLVETDKATVLVDFGAFQGRPDAEEMNRTFGPVKPDALDAVVLTHAHTDHTGRVPLLYGAGCTAPIFSTRASLDLTHILLLDAAGHAAEDLARQNRRRSRDRLPPLRGLVDRDDIERLFGLMQAVPYDMPHAMAPGITVTFRDNGHILGSTSVEMIVHDGGQKRTIVFSGDIGPKGTPILRDPDPPTHTDLVFLESTYGDRDHASPDHGAAQFHQVLRDAIWAQKVVIIPAFAIGRTQSVLFQIAAGIRAGVVPECPLYLDSPMASKTTATYRRHQDLYDEETKRLSRVGTMYEHLRQLTIVDSVEQSRQLNQTQSACIIIAGGGMCEGGRVVHHLKHHLPSTRTEVLVVGYMAVGTLGRQLADGLKTVLIHDQPVQVRAAIRAIDGFSAHAGQTELLEWLGAMARSSPRVALTHGEEPQRTALAAKIKDRFGLDAERLMPGDFIEL